MDASFALVARAGVESLRSPPGGVVYVPPTPTPKFRNDQPRRLVVHCLGVGVGAPTPYTGAKCPRRAAKGWGGRGHLWSSLGNRPNEKEI